MTAINSNKTNVIKQGPAPKDDKGQAARRDHDGGAAPRAAIKRMMVASVASGYVSGFFSRFLLPSTQKPPRHQRRSDPAARNRRACRPAAAAPQSSLLRGKTELAA